MSIKLNAQSGGSVALDAPTQTTSSADNVYKLPVADGSAGQVLQTDGSGNLSWVTLPSAGLTMHDNWYVGGSLSPANGTHYITSNWTRNTNTEAGSIGSAMTESSGVFTFPSTGIYKIDFNGGFYISASANYNYLGFGIFTTLDNSNYSKRIETYQAAPASANNYVMAPVSYVFDVTNTTNCKVRLSTISDGTGTNLIDVGGRYGQVFFTKLGET